MVRTLGIFLVTVLGALVSGCGGSNPKPSPVSSPSTSVSASPSGAPTMPAEAKGTTAASAEAFVRYYLEVFSFATNTGDTTALSSLAAPECNSCATLVNNVKSTYSMGGYARGKGYAIAKLKVVPGRGTGYIELRGSVTQYPQQFKASSSATPETTPLSQLPSFFRLVAGQGGWKMKSWERS